MPDVAPGDVQAKLPPAAPEHPEPFDRVIADLDRVIVPGTTHWPTPASTPSSRPTRRGRASWPTSCRPASAPRACSGRPAPPAPRSRPTCSTGWSACYTDRFVSTGAGGGVIQDSASSATLCAVIAARERALGRGAALDRLVVYASVHAHSALEKGARVAGLRLDQVRLVEADDAHALRADALGAAVDADVAAGRVPSSPATVGTTSSLAVDPVDEVATVAERAGMWLHVDAAMAGSAAVCPELRFEQDGLARADSYVFNPHKWLFTPFDCSCFFVADRRALVGALSIVPEFLRQPRQRVGGGDRLPGLAGAPRPVPGAEAVVRAALVRGRGAAPRTAHVRLAGELARIGADPRLELAAGTPQPGVLPPRRRRRGDRDAPCAPTRPAGCT